MKGRSSGLKGIAFSALTYRQFGCGGNKERQCVGEWQRPRWRRDAVTHTRLARHVTRGCAVASAHHSLVADDFYFNIFLCDAVLGDAQCLVQMKTTLDPSCPVVL